MKTKKDLEEHNQKLIIENKELKKKALITDALNQKIKDKDFELKKAKEKLSSIETSCIVLLNFEDINNYHTSEYDKNTGQPIYEHKKQKKVVKFAKTILDLFFKDNRSY